MKKTLCTILAVAALLAASAAVSQATQIPGDGGAVPVYSNPARPVTAVAHMTFPGGENNDMETLYTVPDGYRLVVEDVSAQMVLYGSFEPDGAECHLSFPAAIGGTQTVVPFMIPFTQVTSDNTDTSYLANQPVRLYVEGHLDADCGHNGESTNTAAGVVTISGYLVPIPPSN
jgi:hypothetical protein